METPKPINRIIENLKPEHLESGFEPIMICVDDVGHYDKSLMENAEYVDYFKNKTDKGNSLQHRDRAYIISDISPGNKYTNELYSCTSIIAVGSDKQTGENISFMSHQDCVAVDEYDSFALDIKKRLNELKSKSQEGSIDIVIVGGMVNSKYVAKNYEDTLSKLSAYIKEVAGFDPIIVGPKEHDFVKDSVLFDDKNRRIYLIRPNNHKVYNDNFRADDLDIMSERWTLSK